MARVAAQDSYTLRPSLLRSNHQAATAVEKRDNQGTATIINGMKPHSIGRTLGIGLRVAGRIAGRHAVAVAEGTPTPGSAPTVATQGRTAGQNTQNAARTAGATTRGVARGVGGFLRPFGRVGAILWLEVMGVFFFLPVAVFAPTLWRIRASWLRGPDHSTFLVTAAIMALFFCLSVNSFLRARKK
jgi:hypothetical protein